MAVEFDWAPSWARLRSRIALGVAVMRVWVGLIVLAVGLGLAALHFRTPPEPAAIDAIVIAHLNRSTAAGGAGGSASTERVSSARRATDTEHKPQPAAAPWERRAIVVGSVQESAFHTVIVPEATESLSGPELTRALQKELRRVGCYYGEIDGDWGPMSKRAMSGFTDRVNATLPTESPDPILLRMVRGYAGEACGTCRTGESRDPGGRCLPAAVLAHAGAAAARGDGRGTSAARSDSSVDGGRFERQPVEPLPGRMAVGAAVDGAGTYVPLTRESAADQDRPSRPRRVVRRARVADQISPSYRWQRRKHWTQTFFDELSRR